jgi:hypothetical protein
MKKEDKLLKLIIKAILQINNQGRIISKDVYDELNKEVKE